MAGLNEFGSVHSYYNVLKIDKLSRISLYIRGDIGGRIVRLPEWAVALFDQTFEAFGCGRGARHLSFPMPCAGGSKKNAPVAIATGASSLFAVQI